MGENGDARVAFGRSVGADAHPVRGDDGTADSSGKEVTGTVSQVDKQNRQIVVDGQTYQLSQGGGAGGGAATMMPAAGDKISFFYKDEGGKKVITRIGQAQQ